MVYINPPKTYLWSTQTWSRNEGRRLTVLIQQSQEELDLNCEGIFNNWSRKHEEEAKIFCTKSEEMTEAADNHNASQAYFKI